MTLLRGTGTMLALNLRSAAHRIGSAGVVLAAFAIAVVVFLSVFEMAEGFNGIIRNSGRGDRLIVLQRGAMSEVASSLSQQDLRELQSATNAPRSPELVTVVRLRTDADGTVVFIPLRGVTPEAAGLRPEVKIIRGRAFGTGRQEVVVGRRLAEEYRSLQPGGQVMLRGHPWQVVGVFASGGDIHESEMLTDLPALAGELQKTTVSSVLLRPEGGQAKDALLRKLAGDSRLAVTVQSESLYYGNQSRALRAALLYLSYGIGFVMAIGACFGALNAMYTSVEARRAEFGTLRAIGARPTSLTVSIVLESTVLASLGALLGVVISWALFDGQTFSTLGESAHLTQLVVETRVTGATALSCVVCACVIGAIAGLVPASRAISARPIAALQAT